MDKPPEPSDPLDAQIGPVMPRDVRALARAYALAPRADPGSETILTIYQAPAYLRWGVEALAVAETRGTLHPANRALLEVGLSLIRQYVGVKAICKARRTVLPLGDAEVLAWFSSPPIVSVDPADTDNSDAYRLHVPKSLGQEFANLSRALGLKSSKLVLFALMAGLLCVPSCVAFKYRTVMVHSLAKLKAQLRRRGEEAKVKAETATPHDFTTDHLATAADLLDPVGDDDADDD